MQYETEKYKRFGETVVGNFPVSVKYSQLKYFPPNWSQAQDTWALNKACIPP